MLYRLIQHTDIFEVTSPKGSRFDVHCHASKYVIYVYVAVGGFWEVKWIISQ